MSEAKEQGHPAFNYLAIFAALLALTIVTVGLSRVNLGHDGNTAMAIAVATLKASLVGLFFMHMKFEKGLMWSLIVIPLLIAVVFLVGLLPDMANHEGAKPDFQNESERVLEFHPHK